MSEGFTPVTSDHVRYLSAHTASEDEFLRALKKGAVEAGLPAIWIAPEQGSLMQILLRLVGARQVIEVGTLAGYSAVWMARALPDGGCVHTIEVSGKHADVAESWLRRSDVSHKVKLYRGAGRNLLPRFGDDSADAMFLDADKASYPLYLHQARRIVRKGGLIMADNAFAFGQLFANQPTRRQEVADIRAFNEIMARSTDLQGIIIPVGDGLWVAAKL